jgi:hypothetical protein
MMPEQVQYQTKLTQSSIFLAQYLTELVDAGMPMPALVFLIPMTSYAVHCQSNSVLREEKWKNRIGLNVRDGTLL